MKSLKGRVLFRLLFTFAFQVFTSNFPTWATDICTSTPYTQLIPEPYAELGALLNSKSASNRRAAMRSVSYHGRMKQGFAVRVLHLSLRLA